MRKELLSCCQSTVRMLPSLFTGALSVPGAEEGAHCGHVLQLGAEEPVTGLQWVNRHKKRLKKCLCLGTERAGHSWFGVLGLLWLCPEKWCCFPGELCK